MMRDDRKRASNGERTRQTRIPRSLLFKELRMLLEYFKPGFHPWKHDDRPELQAWYESPDDYPASARNAPA